MPSDPVVAVRVWPVSLLVMVTLTFGTAAPEGSVTVPVKPEVPDDCAMRDGTEIATRTVSSAAKASREQSSSLDFIVPSPLQQHLMSDRVTPVSLRAEIRTSDFGRMRRHYWGRILHATHRSITRIVFR